MDSSSCVSATKLTAYRALSSPIKMRLFFTAGTLFRSDQYPPQQYDTYCNVSQRGVHVTSVQNRCYMNKLQVSSSCCKVRLQPQMPLWETHALQDIKLSLLIQCMQRERVNLALLLQKAEYSTADTRMVQTILVLMSLVLATHAQSCSYSSLCSDHTMCKYQGYGANCGNVLYSGVTRSTDKQTIVDLHNNLRRQVAQGTESRGNPGPQPSAANMRKISWDDELATVAQRWANQCTFGHDACRKVSRFSVGQNVYLSWTTGVPPDGQQDWSSAGLSWYNEVPLFNRSNVNPFQYSSATGHYTQEVWAETYKIGCGFTAYTSSDGKYNKFYVCNYGPAGNIVGGGTRMYTTGSAGTQCPAGTAPDNGLCATADTTMMLAVLFLMSLVLATHAQSCSYRSLCSDHTMCKYQGNGRNCGSPIYSGVSNADKQTIVDAHNNLRRQVAQGRESRGRSGGQPTAANMRKISWDDELATVAQRWANQCSFGHDACREVGRFSVGQNAYQSSSQGTSPNGQSDWRAAVLAWYNEVKDFNRNDISPFKFTYSTGHYTQVVWADTYKVGCGFTAYKASNGWYNKLYICNYGPSGNYARGSMYK
ncbi:hypothetical protein Cfor_02878, partial [Coptotermes formosanus]